MTKMPIQMTDVLHFAKLKVDSLAIKFHLYVKTAKMEFEKELKNAMMLITIKTTVVIYA